MGTPLLRLWIAGALTLSAGCGGGAAIEADRDRAAEQTQWAHARNSLLVRGDFLSARMQLRAQVRDWPEGGLADDALWVLGHLARRAGRWSDARRYFAALAWERHGASWVMGSYRNARQPWGALWAARMAWLADGSAAARAAYDHLLIDFRDTRAAEIGRIEHEQLSEATQASQAHSTEAHSTEAHSTEAHSTEAHSTEAHSTEAHSTEAHPAEEHPVDALASTWRTVDLSAVARDVGW